MNLNLKSIPCFLRNSLTTASALVSGVLKKKLFSGCNIRVFRELATAFSRTSFRWKEVDVFSFLAIPLISSLFSFVFPCLMCNPFNANS